MAETREENGDRVLLTVPADADFLVLARLALSAVCRLTPLEADDVADLKLALTEAASGLLPREPGADQRLAFSFRLANGSLLLEISGATETAVTPEELELTHAIIEATSDESEYGEGSVRLVKYLQPAAT